MSGDMSIRKLRAMLYAQEFFSVPEAATLLRMDQRTVRRMAESDPAIGVMLRKRWRIRTSWLREQVVGRRDGNDGRAA